MAMKDTICEIKFLESILLQLDLLSKSTPIIKVDNQPAIDLSKNQEYHSRTKHINIQYNFIRDEISTKRVIVEKVATKENIADILAKSVDKPIFLTLRALMFLT